MNPSTHQGDWKVILNNRCRGRATIEYTTIGQGPQHEQIFTCEVRVNGTTWGTGSGKRKVQAECMAAQAAVAYGDSCNKFETL